MVAIHGAKLVGKRDWRESGSTHQLVETPVPVALHEEAETFLKAAQRSLDAWTIL